jgi:hypothetical protein
MRTIGGLDMIRESDIRKQLIAVVQNRLDLADFEDWLVQQSWDMHRDSSPSAQDLVNAIELALAEWSSGHRGEHELRADLARLAHNIQVTVRLSLDGVEPVRLPMFGISRMYQHQAFAHL